MSDTRYVFKYRRGQYQHASDPVICRSDETLPERYRDPWIYYNRIYMVKEQP